MKFTVVVPARYASTRLPGKPLMEIAGKTMVQHVYERARASSAATVVIATDDERIAAEAGRFGAECIMTAADHSSGTDRIEEVSRLLALNADDVVVNVQGDEPLIPPAVIDQVANNLINHREAGIATLCEPITRGEDLFNTDIVKVVTDHSGLALYFSRAPIPWDRDHFNSTEGREDPPEEARRHLGIYAYRVGLLREFVSWPPAALERRESLEQLRAMANGTRIHVADAIESVPPGVDTQADLELVRSLVEA